MDFDTAVYTDATEGIIVDFGVGTVNGGASVGSDTLTSTEGLKGTNFADTINASTYSHTSANGGGVGYVVPGGFGLQGSFVEIEGYGGNDQITGNGNTRISYQNATGAVNADLQTGIVTGDLSVGTDAIVSGVNAVRGSSFNDSIIGRSDNLTSIEDFDGWGGDDFIDGNGGFDRVRYDQQAIAGPNGIVVNLAAGTVTGQDAAATAVVGSDTLRSIESVRASNANDIFNATGFTGPTVPPPGAPSVNNGGDQGSFNEFDGMAGNDQVIGNGNTRIVHYSAQAGIVVTVSGFTNPSNPGAGVSGSVTGDASIGADSFTGVSQIRGSIFNDTFTGFDTSPTGFVEQFDGWAGDDTINGGLGLDRARYDGNDSANYGVPLTDGMMFDLDAGIASGLDASATFSYGTDTLLSVEMVRGTNLHDIFDATGFSGSSANAGSQGTFNEFEGGGGNDEITGNGNTRISYQNAGGGVVVNLTLGNTLGSHSSVGNDSILGGVNQVRGSNFADILTGTAGGDILDGLAGTDTLNGDAGNDRLVGGGGDDGINGGADFDIAVFTGFRSEYAIAPGLNPGQSTVTDSVGGRDGIDSLTDVELIEFSNAYQMNQRNLDISTLTNLVGGRQIIGTNNSNGDNLTIGLNGSGRTIDLAGGGTDTLILASSVTYSINLLNTEAVVSTTTGPTTLILQSAVTNTSVTLGNSFNDVLTLAGGTNIVSVANVETINGGTGIDTVTIGTGVTTVTTVNNVENVFGSGGMDNVILMASPNPLINASLDLGGGTDSVALNIFGATVNLTLTNVEKVTSAGGVSAVNLTNAANGLDIDLGLGSQTLNLASTGNVVTVRNVETLNAFGSANDTVTFFKEASLNQTVNLGFGTNVLNLDGADGSFSMFFSGGSDFTVNGQTSAINENVNVLNLQGGTIFDLGAGANDVVSFANVNATPGVNVASVRNVEQVFGNLAESDQITVLGNAGGTTTVTGGSGTDMMWASADADHFRFASVGDSTNTVTGRDVVNDFDASEDAFVFDNIFGATSLNWIETNVGGGNEVVLVDLNGDANYEMAIQLQNLTGPLTNANFILI